MVKIDNERCIGCRKCIDDCVSRVLYMRKGTVQAGDECLECGHCVAVCPVNAVSLDVYDMNEVIAYDKDTFAIAPENLLNTIKFRRSIRNYKAQTIEADVMEKLVEAGRFTATAKNSQDCRFIVIQEQLEEYKQLIWSELENKLAEAGENASQDLQMYGFFNQMRQQKNGFDYLFRNAPAVIYIASDFPVDAGLAAQNVELMAAASGMGVLYNGFLLRAAEMSPSIMEWLGVGKKQLSVCLLAGYPAVEYRRTVPRKKADVIWR